MGAGLVDWEAGVGGGGWDCWLIARVRAGMGEKKVSLPVRPDGEGGEGGGEAGVWYAEGLRFRCTQCGNCCSGGPGYVWVTEADMGRIAGFLGMEVEAFTKQYVRLIGGGKDGAAAGAGGAYALTEKADYDCVFLRPRGAGGAGRCAGFMRCGRCSAGRGRFGT